jgi:glutathione peroxidase
MSFDVLRILRLAFTMTRGLAALSLTLAAASAQADCARVLDHRFVPLAAEQPVSLCQYDGKVVLVVNTASRCGYTYQYEGLEALWRRYRDRGLVVLGFPANDFGQQEPGSNAQIAEFCSASYGVSFPMFEKLDEPIRRQPLFAELARASGQPPKWNFHKYLIDRKGHVQSFDSSVEPDSARLTRAIDAALGR